MGVGDPILVGNSNVGDVGFGDATRLSADPSGAFMCVLYVEPMDQRDGNGIVGRSWGDSPAGAWAIMALGDLIWSDGLFASGRTAIQAQGNRFGAIVAGGDAVTANGIWTGVRANASGGPDDSGQMAGTGVVSSGAITGVDATGGTTGVAGRGTTVGVQGNSDNGIGVHGVSQGGVGVAAEGATGVAAQASGTAVQATATGGVGSFAVSASANQGTAVQAWSNTNRAVDARSETGTGVYVTAGHVGVAAWSEKAIGVMGSATGPNPLNIIRSGVQGSSDVYAGVRGQSDSGNGVEAVTQKGTAMRAHADAGGTGAYVSAEVDPATGTPGLPLLVEATRVGVTQLPVAARFVGHVEIAGDLIVVGGAKSAAAAGPDGAHLRVYCTEMPEAWIEDAGEAELVDGVADVAIDERLAAIADTGDYQVFLSPYAPVHAYVARRDAGSFEIRLHGEKHHRSVACGWRLMARRSDITAERFAPFTPAEATGTDTGKAPLDPIHLEHPPFERHPRVEMPAPVTATVAPEQPPMPEAPTREKE